MLRKIERIIISIIIIEALLKIIGISFPMRSQLFIMTYTTASFFYLVAGFALFNPGGNLNSNRQPEVDENGKVILKPNGKMLIRDNKDIVGAVILGTAYSIAIMAMLFTLFFWPNPAQMWLIAIGVCIALIIYLLVKTQLKDSDKIVHRKFLLLRAIIVLIISIIFYVTPPSKVLRIVHRYNDEEYLEKMGKTIDNPGNIQYRKEWEEYLDSINKNKK